MAEDKKPAEPKDETKPADKQTAADKYRDLIATNLQFKEAPKTGQCFGIGGVRPMRPK